MMLARRCNRSCVSALVTGLSLFTAGASTEAGSITPWSGASASVQVLDQSKVDSGKTAGASADVQGTIPFRTTNSWTSTDQVLQASVHETASAQATGQASGLLTMDANYQSINMTAGPPLYENPTATASASWTGDSVHLQPPGAASLPDHIVLDFNLNYQVESGESHLDDYFHPSKPVVTVKYNDTTVVVDGMGGASNPGQSAPVGLDQLSASPVSGSYFWNVSAAFHLDLPIDATATSLPFSVSLATDFANGMTYSGSTEAELKNLVLSLDSITLPDGTSVTDAGYGVSFASGMSWPQPNAVPEPASVAVWAGLAAAGAWAARKKKRAA